MNFNVENLNTPKNFSCAKTESCSREKSVCTQKPSFSGGAWEIKNDKLINRIKWVGDEFNSAQQRFISGVTGVALQPWFDYNNKNVDKDTRVVSCARILSKVVVGTVTGVLIRWGLIKAANAFTKTESTEMRRVAKARLKHKTNIKPIKTEFTKLEQCLLPKAYKVGKVSFRDIKKYRNTFGTVAAIGVMLFTNFFVDAPLTTICANKSVKLFTGHAENKKNSEVKTENKPESEKAKEAK